MNENEHDEDDEPEERRNLGQHRAHLVDYGQNQINVGDDPLLKRLMAKHGDRRY